MRWPGATLTMIDSGWPGSEIPQVPGPAGAVAHDSPELGADALIRRPGTPDLVPAAEFWDIDTFMDTWPLMTDVAIHTEKLQIGTTVFDCIRRPPANMAQLTLTLDHYSKGRFFLGLGAGEIKQFAPYGVERDRPFQRLEETVEIVKLLTEAEDIVSYDGEVHQPTRCCR